MGVKNDINQYDSQFIIQFLSKIIIEEYALLLKTKNAFWNFECIDVTNETNLFENQSIEIDSLINQIAKRIIILNDFVELNFIDFKSSSQTFNKKSAVADLVIENMLLEKL